jgi:hypothetical protein
VIRDYATRLPRYLEDRESLETAFLSDAAGMYERYRTANDQTRASALAALTASCFQRAADATAHWTEAVLATPVQHRPSVLFGRSWERFNKQAGFTHFLQQPLA